MRFLTIHFVTVPTLPKQLPAWIKIEEVNKACCFLNVEVLLYDANSIVTSVQYEHQQFA